MKLGKFFLCVFVSIFFLILTASAEQGRYGEKDPFYKFGKGVSKAATSWLDIPSAVLEYSEEYDPVSGTLIGVPVGSVKAVADCAEGTMDATFFFVPPYTTDGKGFFHHLKKLDNTIEEELW